MTPKNRPDELPLRRLIVALLVALCFVAVNSYYSTAAPNNAYPGPDNGLPTETPRYSTYALQALEQVAQAHGLDKGALRIVTDHEVDLPYLGDKYQSVVLVDGSPGGDIYKVFIGVKDGRMHEDIHAVLIAEATAARKQHGNLSAALSRVLDKAAEDAVMRVAVWAPAPPGQTLSEMEMEAAAAVADRFPDAKNIASFDKPMNVADPKLATQIEAEYRAILQQNADARVRQLLSEFEAAKKPLLILPGMPCILVSLSKSEILALAGREDIRLYWK